MNEKVNKSPDKRVRRGSISEKGKKIEKLDLRKFKFGKILKQTSNEITLLGHFGRDLDKKAVLIMKKVPWNEELVTKLNWTRTADGI